MAPHGDDAMRRAGVARRIGVVSVVLICVLVTLTSASAQAFRPDEPQVTAVGARTGEQLPVNPLLHRGSRVTLAVPSYASHAKVVVVLVGVQQVGTVRASSRGVVVYAFTVPSWVRPGRHRLIFTGPASRTKPHPDVSVRSRTRGARATVAVAVPYDPQWPFRTGPPRPHHATGGEHSGPGGQHATQGGASGPPSETGINLLPLLVIGPAALVAGGVALIAGRRRRYT